MDPDDASTIKDVVTAIRHRSHGSEMLVARNFNADLAAPEVQAREKEIAAAMSERGIEDMSGKFLQWRKPWLKNVRTWSMLHGV